MGGVEDGICASPLICLSQISKSTPLIVFGGLSPCVPPRVGVEDLKPLLESESELLVLFEPKFMSASDGRNVCSELVCVGGRLAGICRGESWAISLR